MKHRLLSRKLIVGAAGLVAMIAAFVFAAFKTSAQPVFSPFVTGVVSLAGLYFTSNVVSKFTPTKADATGE